jgi:tyrosyl-tRNA synthetase
VDDRDMSKYLRLFTLMPRAEIEALDKLISSAPEKREAQQALAREVTARVHGEDSARVAEQVSRVLFGKADPASLTEPVLKALSEEVPFAESREAPALLDALVTLKLAASKSAARRLVEQGGVYLNGQRATADTDLGSAKALKGGYHLLRKGARDYGLVRVGR